MDITGIILDFLRRSSSLLFQHSAIAPVVLVLC